MDCAGALAGVFTNCSGCCLVLFVEVASCSGRCLMLVDGAVGEPGVGAGISRSFLFRTMFLPPSVEI